jgi:hypothetical protein
MFVAFQQVGEAGKSLTSRGEILQGVVAEAQVGARARPRPNLPRGGPVELAPGSASHSGMRRPDEARPCDGAEPSLPEVAGAVTPCVDHARVTPMHARERVTQAVFALGGENEMAVIGRE